MIMFSALIVALIVIAYRGPSWCKGVEVEMFRWRVEFTIQQDGKAGNVVVVVAAASNYLALAKAGIQAGHSFGIDPDSVINVKAHPERGTYE